MEAVRQIRAITGDNQKLRNMNDDEVFAFSSIIFVPYYLVMKTKQLGRLSVVRFGAGGIATLADAALMMQLGCDGVIVGPGIFKSRDPVTRARLVLAASHYNDSSVLANVSAGLGEAMVGTIPYNHNFDLYE
ncbi:hypothetical protein L6452_05177 [Arctium lappa]|uniref:Uncharacterized protein n=1 Tax=Arctium lappa TaxID=4217 RepID=A0ACB9EFB9_ARCLA|nr:hypothetical protein L6452_05177 [Arctium lappa]